MAERGAWGNSVEFQVFPAGRKFQVHVTNPTDTERLQIINAIIMCGTLVHINTERPNPETIEFQYFSEASVCSASWEFIQLLREMGWTFDQTARVRAF